ncbi:MAG: hypothetical protein KAX80_16050, partial [Planctomycetes bacterium]|nr:hypothetical protein [Planctomycetota bacterium]
VSGLTDTPHPVTQGQVLRLEATGVHDVDGDYVDAVEFYRDMDGNGILDHTVDVWLGVDPTVGDGWFWMGAVTWQGGQHTYFARARDDLGVWTLDEDAASTTGYVNQRPTITALDDDPDPVTRGEYLTLEATVVEDVDGWVVQVEFYRDSNFSTQLEPDDDALLGIGIQSGSDWELTNISTSGWELGLQTYFARAQDNSDAWSVPAASTTGIVDGAPVVGVLRDDPDPVAQGEPLSLEAAGVVDPEGNIRRVEFYHDDGNWTLEVGTDVLLGTTYVPDALDPTLWRLDPDADTSSYTPGLHMYFARAQDDDTDAWSNVVSTTGRVHQRPTILSVTAAPTPTVLKGNDLTLTAWNAVDPDLVGVMGVRFFRSINDTYDAGDMLLGDGADIGGDEWELVVSTAGWGAGPTPGLQYWYFAQARDNDNGLSDLTLVANARTTGFVETEPPVITGLDAPDVTRGDILTLTATGVSDADGTVALV